MVTVLPFSSLAVIVRLIVPPAAIDVALAETVKAATAPIVIFAVLPLLVAAQVRQTAVTS